MNSTIITYNQQQLFNEFGIDWIHDVLLSQDNVVILVAHVEANQPFQMKLVHGLLTRIGFDDVPSITLDEILSHFDGNNAYAEIGGRKEHYAAVYDLTHDLVKRPVVTFPILTPQGRFWIRMVMYPITKAVNLYSVFISDVTANLVEEESVFRKTHRDSLTTVFNKYALDYHYGLRYQFEDFHVIYLDLDNFKEVNDTRGHPFGDAFLHQFALILRKYEHDYNLFYRIGGDEFVGLFFGTSHDILTVAQSIVFETQQLSQQEQVPQVSVSMGIVRAEQRDDVIRKADQLLYEAKMTGKNQILFRNESEITHYPKSKLDR